MKYQTSKEEGFFTSETAKSNIEKISTFFNKVIPSAQNEATRYITFEKKCGTKDLKIELSLFKELLNMSILNTKNCNNLKIKLTPYKLQYLNFQSSFTSFFNSKTK